MGIVSSFTCYNLTSVVVLFLISVSLLVVSDEYLSSTTSTGSDSESSSVDIGAYTVSFFSYFDLLNF